MAPFDRVPYELVKVKLERKWAPVELMELLERVETVLAMVSRFRI